MADENELSGAGIAEAVAAQQGGGDTASDPGTTAQPAPAEPAQPEVAQPDAAPAPSGGSTDEQTPAEHAAWLKTELPAFHPARAKGLKTFGDLEQQYHSSSSEAKRLVSENQRTAALLQRYHAALQAAQEQQQQRAPAAPAAQPGVAASEVPGFESKAHFEAAYKENPFQAIRRMNEAALMPQIEKLLDERLGKHLAPIQDNEQQRSAREQYAAQAVLGKKLDEQANALMKSDPRFADGGIFYPEANQFIGKHREKLMAMVLDDPDFNLFEFVRNGILAKKLEPLKGQIESAATQRLAQVRAASATARPGSAAVSVPKTGADLRSGAHAVAAQMSAQGHGVSNDDIENLVSAMEEKLRL